MNTTDTMKHDALRRGRLDVWRRVVCCYPSIGRAADRNSNEARLAAIALRDMLGTGQLASADGWHVVCQGEAYRIACLLQS